MFKRCLLCIILTTPLYFLLSLFPLTKNEQKNNRKTNRAVPFKQWSSWSSCVSICKQAGLPRRNQPGDAWKSNNGQGHLSKPQWPPCAWWKCLGRFWRQGGRSVAYQCDEKQSICVRSLLRLRSAFFFPPPTSTFPLVLLESLDGFNEKKTFQEAVLVVAFLKSCTIL